jgi:hypothetical protein
VRALSIAAVVLITLPAAADEDWLRLRNPALSYKLAMRQPDAPLDAAFKAELPLKLRLDPYFPYRSRGPYVIYTFESRETGGQPRFPADRVGDFPPYLPGIGEYPEE